MAGRTRRNKLVHLRRSGSRTVVRPHRPRRPVRAARRGRRRSAGDRARRRSIVIAGATATGKTGARRSSSPRRSTGRGRPPRSSPPTRARSTAASTSARPRRRPRSGRASRTTASISSTPTSRSASPTSSTTPTRRCAAIADARRRRDPRRRHRALPAGRRPRPRHRRAARATRRPRAARGATSTADGLPALVARLRALAPRARGRRRPAQPAPRRPRARDRRARGRRAAAAEPRGYPGRSLWLGLAVDPADHRERIAARARAQFDAGLIDEARALRAPVRPGSPGLHRDRLPRGAGPSSTASSTLRGGDRPRRPAQRRLREAPAHVVPRASPTSSGSTSTDDARALAASRLADARSAVGCGSTVRAAILSPVPNRPDRPRRPRREGLPRRRRHRRRRTAGPPRTRSPSSPTSPTTAGADVVGAEWQNRRHVDPNWYVGKGKAEELRRAPSARPASTSSSPTTSCRRPSSARSRSSLKVKVIDRSRLILDIFALHAQTHEGRLQVELAQLEYQLPRLTKLWTHLSRTQRRDRHRGDPARASSRPTGGSSATRIAKMKERVEQVRQQRATAARGRDRRLWPTVGIVGYTNAGKSTLLNALVGSEVALAEDKLFATLDPTSRQVKLGDGQTAIVTDTVGLHPQAAAPARRRLPGDARGGQPGRRADRGRRRRPTRHVDGAPRDRPDRPRRARGRRQAAPRGLQQGRPARPLGARRRRRRRRPSAARSSSRP